MDNFGTMVADNGRLITVNGGQYNEKSMSAGRDFNLSIHLQRDWVRPVFNDPFFKPDEVVGREDEMQYLADQLIRSPQRRIIALTGISGAGKTTLAKLFVAQHSADFPGGVLWANPHSESITEEQVQPILDRWGAWAYGGEQVFQSLFQVGQIHFTPAAVSVLLTGHGRLLMVIDDARNQPALKALIEAAPPEANILITTEYRKLIDDIALPRELGNLNLESGLVLLRHNLPGVPDQDLRDLAAALGFQPQEMQFASAQLRQVREADRAEEVRKYSQRARQGKISEKASTALKLNYEDLLARSPEEARCFRKLGILSVTGAAFTTQAASRVFEIEESQAERFLESLYDRSLVTRAAQTAPGCWNLPTTLRSFTAELLQESGERELDLAHYLTYYREILTNCMQAGAPCGGFLGDLPHLIYLFDHDLKQIETNSGESLPGREADPESILIYWYEAALYLRRAYAAGDYLQPLSERAAKAAKALQLPVQAYQFWSLLGSIYREHNRIPAALEAYQQALSCSRQHHFSREEIWAQIAIAGLQREAGKDDLAEGVYLEALSLAEARDLVDLQVLLIEWLGVLNSDAGRFRPAIGQFERALKLSQKHLLKESELEIQIWLGQLYAQMGEATRALTFYQDAQRIAREIGDRQAEVNILISMGRAYEELEQPAQALETFDLAQAVLVLAGQTGSLQEAYLMLDQAVSLCTSGEYERAMERIGGALELAERLRGRLIVCQLKRFAAAIEQERGNISTAIELMKEILPDLNEIPGRQARNTLAYTLAQLSSALYTQGNLQEALQQGLLAWDALLESQDRRQILWFLTRMGALYRSLGESLEGIAFFQKAHQVAVERKYQAASITARCWLAILYSEKGQTDNMLKTLEMLPPRLYADQFENTDEQVIVSYMLGLGYTLQSKLEEARTCFEESLKRVKNRSHPAGQAQTLEALADMYIRLEQYGEAERYIIRALPLADQLNNTFQQADLYYKQALVLEAQNKRDESVAAIENASHRIENQDPSELTVRILMFKSRLLWATKHLEEALQSYAEAEKSARKVGLTAWVANAMFLRGAILFISKNDYPQGQAVMAQAIDLLEKDPQEHEFKEQVQILHILVDIFKAMTTAEAQREVLVKFLKVTNWDAARVVLMQGGLLFSDDIIRLLDLMICTLNGTEGDLVARALRIYRTLLKDCRSFGTDEGLRRTRENKEQHALHYWWGAQHRALREYWPALKELNTAIQLKSDEPAYYIERGWINRGLGSYNQALGDFEKAFQISREPPGAFLGRGAVLYELRKYQAALEDFTKAIRLSQENAYAFHWRGAARQALGATSDAVEDFTRAIQLDAKERSHYYWRGLAYLEIPEYLLALEDFERLIGYEKDQLIDLTYDTLWKGVSLQLLGRSKQSMETFTKASELARQIPTVLERSLVTALLETLQYHTERAREHYLQAMRTSVIRHALHSHHRYISLLTRLYPMRTDIQTFQQWFSDKIFADQS
jgi:tetratricopeptide (TPR) repeat protein